MAIATLSGYLTDDVGNGINGATAELYANGSGVVTATTTTANDSNSQAGYWAFAGAADGLYKIKISYNSKIRWLYGASIPQFNGLVVGQNKFSVSSAGDTVISGALNTSGSSIFSGTVTSSANVTATASNQTISSVRLSPVLYTGGYPSVTLVGLRVDASYSDGGLANGAGYHGINISDVPINTGGGGNYSIYTGAGNVRFGGPVTTTNSYSTANTTSGNFLSYSAYKADGANSLFVGQTPASAGGTFPNSAGVIWQAQAASPIVFANNNNSNGGYLESFRINSDSTVTFAKTATLPIGTGINAPYSKAYIGVGPSVTGGSTSGFLGFDANELDNGSVHETVTHPTRFTAPHSGIYWVELFCAANFSTPDTTAWMEIQVFKNGTQLNATRNRQYTSGNNSGGYEVWGKYSSIYSLSGGDYIEFKVHNYSAQTFSLDANQTTAVMFRLP